MNDLLLQCVILPIDDQQLVVRPRPDGTYDVVASMPFGATAQVKATDDGYIVRPAGTQRVEVFQWRDDKLAHAASLVAPPTLPVADIASRGRTIYIGGGGAFPSTELVASIGLDDRAGWKFLPVPAHCAHPGKRADALLVDGHRLIAVDNVIIPKWFIEYDIRDPERPTVHGTPDLMHGANEHAESGAALGPHHVAVRSVAITMGGFSRLIRLYDRVSLAPVGVVRASHAPSADLYESVVNPARHEPRMRPKMRWHQIVFVDGALLIAGGRDGVGSLNLRALPREAKGGVPDVSQSVGWLREYQREVVGIVPVERFGGCYVIVEAGGVRSVSWRTFADLPS